MFMKNRCQILFALPVILLALFGIATPVAASDCNAVASDYATRKGGEVISVSAIQNGNKTECEVTLRMPSKDGKPPRVVTKSIKD
jgi:hypothetical protein